MVCFKVNLQTNGVNSYAVYSKVIIFKIISNAIYFIYNLYHMTRKQRIFLGYLAGVVGILSW